MFVVRSFSPESISQFIYLDVLAASKIVRVVWNGQLKYLRGRPKMCADNHGYLIPHILPKHYM